MVCHVRAMFVPCWCHVGLFFRFRARYREGTVAIPSIGGGIFGFEPKNSSLTLMEEAFDTLLQVEATRVAEVLKLVGWKGWKLA